MPVIPLEKLDHGRRFSSSLERILDLTPGIVIVSGQAASGKVTTLLALALRAQRNDQNVVILTDQSDSLKPFEPLPSRWSLVKVQPNAAAWDLAVSRHAGTDDLLLCVLLSRENAKAILAAASTPRWIFVAVDTALAGLDLSYVLRDMGIAYAAFAENVRLILSMLLLPALCDHCGVELQLQPAEAELLVPDGNIGPVKLEVGCAECDEKGTDGMVALSDITTIVAAQRDAVEEALVKGNEIVIDPEFHLSAQDEAREYLAHGVIGLNTFREAIQRNPLLRSQHALEMVKAQAEKLARSLWLDVDLLTALADRSATGMLVAEVSGKVSFANALARQATPIQGEIAIVDEHVCAKSPRIARLLAEALTKAVNEKPVATRIRGTASSAGNKDIFVTPLPTALGYTRGVRRLALVLVGQRGQVDNLPSEDDLRQLFEFTSAETKVALMLCRGRAPKEIARELGLSVATVRSHMSALLGKSGTSRQVQLVSLLMSLPLGRPVPSTVAAAL